MEVPPNYGPDYSNAFRGVFRSLANKHGMKFMPCLRKDVGGHPELNQADGIHPNKEGQRIIAENMVRYIMEFL